MPALLVYLAARGETVLEVGRGRRDERRLRGKDDSSTQSAPLAQRCQARHWRCREQDSGERRCGCCWLLGAAPSTSAGKRSCQLRSVIVTAQVIVAWSHHGRVRSEAAFARLAGVAPIPASSGQTTRQRLSRGGDRQLNAPLHTVVLHRRCAIPRQAQGRFQKACDHGHVEMAEHAAHELPKPVSLVNALRLVRLYATAESRSSSELLFVGLVGS